MLAEVEKAANIKRRRRASGNFSCKSCGNDAAVRVARAAARHTIHGSGV